MDLQIVQAAFMLGFVAMAAGAFYFFMERGDLKPEHSTVGTYAAVIALIASIMYAAYPQRVRNCPCRGHWRNVLGATVSRDVRHAQTIVENTALGQFPLR